MHNNNQISTYMNNEWRDWMDWSLSLTPGTIDSYSKTYLPGILKRLTDGNNLMSSLPSMLKNNPWKTIEMLYLILDAWRNQLHPFFQKNTLKQKTIANYASALECYIEFLIDLISNGLLVVYRAHIKALATFTRPLQQKHLQYPQDVLIRIFKIRLGTQDRFPVNGVYFPIRLIKKIITHFGGKTWISNWLTHYAKGIRILAQKEIYRVGEIETLDIFGDSVWVNQKQDRVLTETCNSQRPNPDKMYSKTIARISIDHNVPISITLAAGGWHALDKIKVMVDKWYKLQNPNAMSINQSDASTIAQGVFGDFCKLPQHQQKIICDGLKKDLERIAVDPLTLMERGENSKKSNNLGCQTNANINNYIINKKRNGHEK